MNNRNQSQQDFCAFIQKQPRADLFKYLAEWNDLYYNGGNEEPVPDWMYDMLQNYLGHSEIGALPKIHESTKLPAPMTSLDKITDKKSWENYLNKHGKDDEWIIMPKYDGLAALWCEEGLFTRGNGIIGRNITHLKDSGIIKLPDPRGVFIRGEIVVKKPGTRNIAAGIVNRKIHSDETKLYFYPWDVESRNDNKPCELFHHVSFTQPPSWEECNLIYSEWVSNPGPGSKEIDVAIDGIVVFKKQTPQKRIALKFPSHQIIISAFVDKVIWNTTMNGQLKPVIIIDPVELDGAIIKRVTGHNWRFITKNKIGPGAEIVICRSGHIIPSVVSVKRAAEQSCPIPENAKPGEVDLWDTTINFPKLVEHFVKSLDIKHIGPQMCKKIAENVDSPEDILYWDVDKWIKICGETIAKKIYGQIAGKKFFWYDLVSASNLVPGIGKTRWRQIADHVLPVAGENLDKLKIPGLGKILIADILVNWDKVVSFVLKNSKLCETYNAPRAEISENNPLSRTYCFTGFRDSELSKKIISRGYNYSNTFSKKITHLVIEKDSNSEKINAAKKNNVEIVNKIDLINEIND